MIDPEVAIAEVVVAAYEGLAEHCDDPEKADEYRKRAAMIRAGQTPPEIKPQRKRRQAKVKAP